MPQKWAWRKVIRKEGQLLGAYLLTGIKRIDQVSEKLGIDPEVSLLIQHMILTHQYEPEFGSPKQFTNSWRASSFTI